MEFLMKMEDKMWSWYEDIELQSYVLIIDYGDFYWRGIDTFDFYNKIISVIKLNSGFIVFAVVST